jgi:hypothetical protein
MVNFEPPLPKSLPEAQLFKILSEIPADSAGMQRAADLIAEHERAQLEDRIAFEAWVAELQAEGSEQAARALAKHAGITLAGHGLAEDLDGSEVGQPTDLRASTAAVPYGETPVGFDTNSHNYEEPTSPEVQPQRLSFESLITGSTPLIANPTSMTAAVSKSGLTERLYLPVLLAIVVFAAGFSVVEATVVSGAVILGALLSLLSSRGGASSLGAILNIAFGTFMGRVLMAITLVAATWFLSQAAVAGAGRLEVLTEAMQPLVAIGVLSLGLALGLIRSTWFARLWLLLPTGLAVWMLMEASIGSIVIGRLQPSDFAWAALGIFVGFVTQSTSLPLPKSGRVQFTLSFVLVFTAAAFLGGAVTLNVDPSLLIAISAIGLSFAVGHEASASAKRARAPRLLALLLLGGFAAASGFELLPASIGHWLLIAVLAGISIAVADALLRNEPVHQASTEQNFGFYGATSGSALLVWLLAALGATALLTLSGSLDLGLTQLFATPWLDLSTGPLVAMLLGTLLGLMRFAAVRRRELDQVSASGDTKLENLLGL